MTLNFSFPAILIPGLNTFKLTALDKAGNSTTTVLHLTYVPVSATIISPANGATIDADNVLITGTFEGSVNTGIAVNGVMAALDGNRFYAQVPLQTGANTLALTATIQDGQTITKTIIVTSTGASPIGITARDSSGFAPLDVSFLINNRTANAIQRIEVDFDGNGTIDFSTADPNAVIAFVYKMPGVYQAKLTITDSLGNKFESIKTIVVQSVATIDIALRGIYTGMLDKLRAGNIDEALTAVSSSGYEKYKAVFTTLRPRLPVIVDQLGTIQDGTIGNQLAEYVIARNTSSGPQAFLIYFIRGKDGVWRIDGL